MTGRKPKPTKLKLLTGNPGKRPLNDREPQPVGKAECPEWLSDEAKTEWRRLSEQLETLGLLSSLDRAVFAVYCQSWADWKHACMVIAEQGAVVTGPGGVPVKHPMVTIKNEAARRVLSAAGEFGFSPSARSRLQVAMQETPADKMRAFLES